MDICGKRLRSAAYMVGAVAVLLAAPGAAQAQFGGSIAVVDGDVVVGEPQRIGKPGAVHVYRRSGADWIEVALLTASEQAGDGFGTTLVAQGNTLIVGAGGPATLAGGAYIFERGASGEWRQVEKLEPDSAGRNSGFGFSLALQKDVAFVGAPVEDEQRGAVYVFRRGANGWERASKLTASDAAQQAIFGFKLAVDGDRAIVYSIGRGVYAFQLENGTWTEKGKLQAEQMQGNPFSASVLLHDGLALVGMPSARGGAGGVFAFTLDIGSELWSATGVIVPEDTTQRGFGSALVLSGEQLLIGAGNASEGRGAIHVYERDASGAWHSSGTVRASDAQPNDNFGGAIAVSQDVMVVGMTGADYNAGKALVFEGGPGRWNPTRELITELDEYGPVVGTAIACEEQKTAADFGCVGVELLSFLPISKIGGGRGVQLSDIWGWTDPETGREYALVGRVNGTSFVDITDPVNPVYVGDLPMTEGARANAWRDIKVYKDHAYVVADGAGPHGMQVFDLTRLRAFEGEPITFTADAHYDRIHSAHNIVINEESGFAYPVGAGMGGETCGGGLHMIDIREPKNPAFAGCFADTETGNQKTGYSHDAQCVIYRGPDQDYQGREICVGSNETAISIADVTDKSSPKAISRASYPNVSYTHQGWFTEDHRYFFVNDEGDEISGLVPRTRTLIWDLQDLDDPVLAKEFLGTTAASDHNLYIKGNLVFQSNYASGLRILDITDPLNPVEVGFLDTQPVGENSAGFTGAWSNYPFFRSGTIAVSSIEQGVFFIRKTPTARPIS